MTTETIKIEENWSVRTEIDNVTVYGPEGAYVAEYFKGKWENTSRIPLSVRAAAERLWQTIRPLQSGTSPEPFEAESSVSYLKRQLKSACDQLSEAKTDRDWQVQEVARLNRVLDSYSPQFTSLTADRDAWKERAEKLQEELKCTENRCVSHFNRALKAELALDTIRKALP